MIYLVVNFFFFLLYGTLYRIAKKKKPLKRAFFTMLIGLCTLIIVDIAGIFTDVYLPISLLSVTISACGGIPGVAAMIIFSWVL